eukprot:356816-Chlamydomonas_euryale.AAC.3
MHASHIESGEAPAAEQGTTVVVSIDGKTLKTTWSCQDCGLVRFKVRGSSLRAQAVGLSCSSLPGYPPEAIGASTRGRAARSRTCAHLAVGLDAMLQAVELPAGVADLATGLADMDGDCLTHGGWLGVGERRGWIWTRLRTSRTGAQMTLDSRSTLPQAAPIAALYLQARGVMPWRRRRGEGHTSHTSSVWRTPTPNAHTKTSAKLKANCAHVPALAQARPRLSLTRARGERRDTRAAAGWRCVAMVVGEVEVQTR